jgi:hypothetical protein
VSAASSKRIYDNAALGVRFEIDDSFVDGAVVETSVDAPGNVRSAYLAARGREGSQTMLSISRVEVGYDTSPHELAEQLVIHNRYAAHTAEQNGWTIHSPWKATMLSGYPAMHCDYVVPEPAARPPSADDAALPFAPPAGEASTPGHLQAWVVYAGRATYQFTFSVNPPGDLSRNRAVAEAVVRTLEIGPAARGGAATLEPR